MAMVEKIRILLVKQGNISEAELARRLGTSPQNLSKKFKRDNLSEKDLQKIAEVMGCRYEAGVRISDTGEFILSGLENTRITKPPGGSCYARGPGGAVLFCRLGFFFLAYASRSLRFSTKAAARISTGNPPSPIFSAVLLFPIHGGVLHP